MELGGRLQDGTRHQKGSKNQNKRKKERKKEQRLSVFHLSRIYDTFHFIMNFEWFVLFLSHLIVDCGYQNHQK